MIESTELKIGYSNFFSKSLLWQRLLAYVSSVDHTKYVTPLRHQQPMRRRGGQGSSGCLLYFKFILSLETTKRLAINNETRQVPLETEHLPTMVFHGLSPLMIAAVAQ